jgi:hypothetical protein
MRLQRDTWAGGQPELVDVRLEMLDVGDEVTVCNQHGFGKNTFAFEGLVLCKQIGRRYTLLADIAKLALLDECHNAFGWGHIIKQTMWTCLFHELLLEDMAISGNDISLLNVEHSHVMAHTFVARVRVPRRGRCSLVDSLREMFVARGGTVAAMILFFSVELLFDHLKDLGNITGVGMV